MDNHYQDTSAAAEECSEAALAGLDDDDDEDEDEPDLKDAENDEEVGDTETLISFAEFDQAVAQLRDAGVQVSSKQSSGLKKKKTFIFQNKSNLTKSQQQGIRMLFSR